MAEPARIAVRFLVRGRVQGVSFRDFTRRRALELGVSGWVRNETDGAVAVEAVGDPESVATFRAALQSGPRLARVDAVEETPLEDAPAWTGFAIRF